MKIESSPCEKPERHASRTLSDHLVLEGQKRKVHSLVDKVYSRKNLKLAWERVRANQGAGGTDGVTIGEFEADLDANLERLHRELREKTFGRKPCDDWRSRKEGLPARHVCLHETDKPSQSQHVRYQLWMDLAPTRPKVGFSPSTELGPHTYLQMKMRSG